MGLFSFFKPKPLSFQKRCIIAGPNYLNGKFRDIPDELMNTIRIKESEYFWTRQITSSSGSTKFRISYFGNKIGNSITRKSEMPPIVSVLDIENHEEFILFDGALHGYNAVFWQEFPTSIKYRTLDSEYKINGNAEFEIVMCVRYSAHIKEQFDEDFSRYGFVENNRGEKVGQEAFLDGYDSIVLFAIGLDGKKIEILSEETA